MMKERNDTGGNRRWKKNYSLSSVDGEKTVLVGCNHSLGTIEDAFEDLERIHLRTLHSKDRKFFKHVQEVYGNSYPQEITRAFVSFCPSCNSKHQFPETRAGNTPITHDGPWKCVQIGLIDFSKEPDGDLKYILSVKDHFTKYAFLRGLKNKTQKEVANEMLAIFSDFGVPSMIHSDNGGEFSSIVSQLILYKTVLVSTAL